MSSPELEALRTTALVQIASELELLRITLYALVPDADKESMLDAVEHIQKKQKAESENVMKYLKEQRDEPGD